MLTVTSHSPFISLISSSILLLLFIPFHRHRPPPPPPQHLKHTKHASAFCSCSFSLQSCSPRYPPGSLHYFLQVSTQTSLCSNAFTGHHLKRSFFTIILDISHSLPTFSFFLASLLVFNILYIYLIVLLIVSPQ